MNVKTTMTGLYIARERFDYLATQMEKKGFAMAAEELKREAKELGGRLCTLQSILDDYQSDVDAAQALPDKPAKFYGVDRAEVKL